MKKRTTLLKSLVIVFSLISIISTAQTSQCDCWQTRDLSYQVVTMPIDISGPNPVTPYYRNDDAYNSTVVTLPFNFCFYGTSVSQITIDNNGYVTFGNNASGLYGNSSSYEPQTFPIPTPAVIAPFWSDVYTRFGSGPAGDLVWYKVTNSHVIIQWDSVGYYGTNSSSQDNSFQLIITNGNDPILPNENNIEFCYQEMGWAVGSAQQGVNGFNSPSNPATVGINKGNGTSNIQYGLFNLANSNYIGPYPPTSSYDGVYWLIDRQFLMDGCSGNASPFVMTGGQPCGDTLKLCEGDTGKYTFWFYSVIPNSPVTTVLATPTLSGVTLPYNHSYGTEDSVEVQIVGTATNTGIHTIGLYTFDNTAPPDSLYTTIVVDISPAPPVTISALPDTICMGNSSVLTAGGGLTYLWSTGGTSASITVAPTVTTTYSVAISTSGCTKDTSIQVVVEPPVAISVSPLNTGVCMGDSVQLTASGGTIYTWLPANGLSCYTCANPKAAPAASTVYTITSTSNGCSSTVTDTVNVYPIPVVTATTSADTICSGSTATLSASGAATYVWTPGVACSTCASPTVTPSVTTTYTVIGTSAEGCSSSATVTIDVFPLPVLTVSPNVSICPNRTVTLIASGDGSSFTWVPGNISGPSITVTPTVTTTYTVTMPTGCGNSTATVTVNVNPQPVPSFDADITAGCAPLCAQFRNRSSITSGVITAWAWSFGTGDTSIIQNPIYCYQNPGRYSIQFTVTSDSGCSATLYVSNYMTVYSHPDASFSISPQPATMLSPTIAFTDNSTDAYGLAFWQWSFGDATDSLEFTQNASHTYQDTGTYCATEIVTNIHGCVDSLTQCLAIGPLYELYIPSGFTPDGNGRNDVFMPKGNDIKSFEMYIFDRWGMQLFHSTDINNGWNGSVNGNGTTCQEDTYIYKITVYDSKNIEHNYTGSVNLIK